ncbi:hypothetical protein EYC84_008905 [Monilinia fructicola]|uniref:RRM domain-containing protein n=1 Tax=Monilinia fructicola TaxID=38448 RepID=A0A5M9JAG0_MONFR|nr:hypothetical protein EYC84_008905 [Monilinia fructicola]
MNDVDQYFTAEMVPSFVPMFMLALMDVPRAPVSLLSNHPMMLAMLSSSSMVMIGKVAHLRSAKIVSQVHKDSVVHVEDLVEVAVDSVAALEDVEASVVAVVDLAVDLAGVVVASEEVTLEALADSTVVLVLPQLAPNPFTDYATAGTERSEIIFVRNLPWSTSNEDLVELFTTIGKVEQAEIQYEPNGRSRGTGVKFSGYQYGGRPLGLSFVKYQTPGGAGDAMDTEVTHLTQDQIM